MQHNPPEPLPRYCAVCGHVFADRDGDHCPRCGQGWSPRSFNSVATIATMLTELRWLREDGIIDPPSYGAARALYERRLESVRGRAPAVAAMQPAPAGASPVPTVPAARTLPWRTDGAAAPPPVPRESLGEWAAARQADILLYLGAFLLSIAALIFIGYQGEALGGGVRCLVLLAYTVAFLGLGILLPRWDRVREAGPVFLALGALLLPANFIAIRTQVLSPGDLPEDILWLLGAGVTGVLYLILAARGFGRLCALPGALALAVAYGALGSVLRLYPDWFGPWFGGGAAALATASLGLPVRRWVEGGALAAGLFGLLAAHAVALDNDPTRWQLPLSYLLALSGAGVLAQQRRLTGLAALPATAALLALTGWWAAFGLDPPWWSVFLAAGGLGYLALAERDRERRDAWRGIAAGAAVLALTFAYSTLPDGGGAWQVPATWLLILAGGAWEGYRGRVAGTLLLPAAAGLLAQGMLLAWDTPAVWSSYPLLGIAVIMLLSEAWWSRRPLLDRIGWPYALLVALCVPLGFVEQYGGDPWHGVAGFALAALVFVAAALRTRGALARLALLQAAETEPSPRLVTIERQSLARAGSALLFVAAAYLNAALGLAGADQAWVFAGIGAAAWVTCALLGRRQGMLGIFLPAAAAAVVVATALGRDEPARASLILTTGVMGAGWVFATTRRASLWLIAAVAAAAHLAFDWRWRDLDPALFPLACLLLAVVLTVLLTRRRDYSLDERGWTVTLLSWAPWLYTIAAAVVLLALRAGDLPAGAAPPTTREWAVLAIVLAGAAVAVAAEGRRLRAGAVVALGSGGLMLALLLAIAIAQPENVQAYTLPAGLYLIGVGFAWQRAPKLIERHLSTNEAAQILGMLTVVLPAAEQAWQPGGGRFGLELIGVGLVLSAAGVALSARWLAVGGVLTLTGVALRWLLTESEIPYWLTLGVAGMALLILGTLLLLERERWDRLRGRMKAWWTRTPYPVTPA